MRITVIIAFFILGLCSLPLFSSEFQNSSNKKKQEEFEYKDSWIFGGSINFPVVKGTFYEKTEQLKSLEDAKITYGIELSTDKLFEKFHIKFKTGKLIPSGALSKSNNPLLSSSVSPFSTASTSSCGIIVNLPETSSYTKPFSFFLQYSFGLKNPSIKNAYINIFFSPESEESKRIIAASYFQKILLYKKISVNYSSTVGIFQFKEHIPSSWFSAKATDFYSYEENRAGINSQFAFDFKNISAIIGAYFYENPDGNISTVFKNENKYSRKKTTINFSQCYCPEFTITSSEKKISPILQYKLGFQYAYIFYNPFTENPEPVFFKTGISSYFDYFLCEEIDSTLNLALGYRIIYKKFTGNFSAGLHESLNPVTYENQLEYLSLQLKNGIAFNFVKPSLACTLNFTPDYQKEDWKTTVKFSFLCGIGKNPYFSNTTSVSFSEKNNQIEGETYSTSLSVKYTQTFFTIFGKLTFKWENKASK